MHRRMGGLMTLMGRLEDRSGLCFQVKHVKGGNKYTGRWI